MTYQDVWIKGMAAANGYRECDSRYTIVRDYCSRFEGRPFTVCDIGANMCYFGLRLTEDFPNCSVMAFEFDHFKLRQAHVERNSPERLLFINRKVSIADLVSLETICHFDVVLALSVIHHLPGPHVEWLAALRGLGDNLIAEFALDDSTRVAVRNGYRVPEDAVHLGYGVSHLNGDIKRPIVVMQSNAKENQASV